MAKKIGLITFLSENYGTQLQAFALFKAIGEVGTPFFIDYKRSSISKSDSKRPRWRSIGFVRLLNLIFLRRLFRERSEAFRKFTQKYISGTSEAITSIDELKRQSNSVEALVCGSDMIWSAEFEQHLRIYLLTWYNGLKVSYAPSIGDLSLAANLSDTYRTALKDFRALSCREQSASSFISELTGRKVTTVLDPTLLFDKNQWLNFFPDTKRSKHQGYVLVYCFSHPSEAVSASISTVCKRLGTKRRNVLIDDIGAYINELNFGNGVFGPAEFVRMFSEASFTVVDGYHGLIFSLIFEIPFVVIHRGAGEHWAKHENRMSELLNELGLSDRYINHDSGITSEMMHLDYTEISRKLQQKRIDSLAFLNNALND